MWPLTCSPESNPAQPSQASFRVTGSPHHSEFVYLEQSINYFLIFILIFRMFAANFACLLIFAQTEENRLTQFPVAGPLSEFDLRDESRIYPVHFPHHRRRDALHPLASLF